MAHRDVLAIGTSAGGVEAIVFLVKRLPRDLPASLLVTLHLPLHARSVLDEILNRAGLLPAEFAKDGEMLRKSRIYIAPPNRHLLLTANGFCWAKVHARTTPAPPSIRCCAR